MSSDYENETQQTFDLTVIVADRAGLTDKTQVRITVLDVNDNLPMIINLPSPAEFNISDNVPAGELTYNVILKLPFFTSFPIFILPYSLSSLCTPFHPLYSLSSFFSPFHPWLLPLILPYSSSHLTPFIPPSFLLHSCLISFFHSLSLSLISF
jgi:hypothetical protein